jgi:Fe-S cluster biogenesis protein NfuA
MDGNHDLQDGPRTLDDFRAAIDRFDEIIGGWEPETRATVRFHGDARDALQREALRRLISALNTEPAARAALRASLGDEVIYAVLRYHGLVKPSLDERIGTALAGIRPMLAEHNGDVELVRLEPPTVELRLTGACDHCPASMLTFHEAIARAVRDACPEITDVVHAKR